MATKQTTKTAAEQAVEVGASTKTVPREEIVRKAILEANRAIEENYVSLAQLLYEAYHKEFWQAWGFKDFREYVEGELDMHYRKSMYLVDIWDKVKKLNLSKAKIEKLGWTKMKDIASVITEANAKEWLDKADKMTSRELTEAVKIHRTADTSQAGTVPMITTMTFKLSEAEARIVTEAIEEGKKLCETENAVAALEMICQDWMEMKGVSPTRTSLDDRIQFMEAAYGVKITWAPKGEEAGAAAEAETAKTTAVEVKAEKKATKRKAKGEAAPSPEENPETLPTGPAGGQDINTLLGIGG